MAGKMFKGTDRRMMKIALASLRAIHIRDVRADDPKTTRKLSTRNKVFSLKVDPVSGQLWLDLAGFVGDHIETLLALNEGDPAP